MKLRLDAALDALADDFLVAWQEAHGFIGGQARPMVGRDRLAVLIEGAFSQAELKLAEQQSGGELLRHYAVELLQDISGQMYVRIEEVVNQPVISDSISVSPDCDLVMFVFRLGERLGDEESAIR